jgi:hypothetical protein
VYGSLCTVQQLTKLSRSLSPKRKSDGQGEFGLRKMVSNVLKAPEVF